MTRSDDDSRLLRRIRQELGRYRWLNLVSLAIGSIALVVAFFLPVWKAWYFNSWEGSGRLITGGEAARRMFEGDPQIDYVNWLFVWHGQNWVQAVAFFAIPFAVARIWLGIANRHSKHPV